MGRRFAIHTTDTAPSDRHEIIQCVIESLRGLEQKFCEYQPGSDINRINSWAGISPVGVSGETLSVLQRAASLSKLTSGAFRVSYSAERTFFSRTAEAGDPVIDPLNRTVYLPGKNWRLNLSGLCLGYAMDTARELLKKEGVRDGVIYSTGCITTWGRQANGDPWTLGAAHPAFMYHLFSYACIGNQSVAIQGNQQHQWRKLGYCPEPDLREPPRSERMGIQQVMVISPDAELSCSLAQSIYRLGVHPGLELLNKMEQTTALILDESYHLHTTRNIHLL
ncbi:MAG TPA: FAD:protein FMN transferase [Flavihumibacter sp.]|jgi:thiamine biosynthesis lipoprotein